MKKEIRFVASAGVVLALWLPVSAHAQEALQSGPALPTSETYRIEVLAGYWSPRADIVVSSDAPGIPGTRIDLQRDLGLTNQGFPELQVVLRPGLRHKFRLQYIPIRYDSMAAPPRDVIFNGATYRASVPVTSRLDWKTYRFGYEYDVIVRPRWFLGLITEVKHTIVEAHLLSAAADEQSRQAMPIPAVGGIVRVYPAARLSLTGELTFFGVPDRADGHYGGHVADGDVSAIWNVSRHLGAQVGFRDIDINHLGEWNTATFTLKGIYVGAVVRY